MTKQAKNNHNAIPAGICFPGATAQVKIELKRQEQHSCQIDNTFCTQECNRNKIELFHFIKTMSFFILFKECLKFLLFFFKSSKQKLP